MTHFFKTLYRQSVLAHPIVAVLIVFSMIVLALSQIAQLKLDASADALTLEYDEDLDYFRKVYQQYQTGDFLVVTYKPQDDLFSDAALEQLARLRDDLVAVPGVASASTILDVPLLYSPKMTFSEISKGPRRLLDDDVDRAMAQEEFQNSPIYKDMLLGPDGKTTAVYLSLAIDNKYLDLVRSRDELRRKANEQPLTDSERKTLEQLSKDFANYSEQAAARSAERVEQVRAITDQYKESATIFVGGVSMITADMIRFIQHDLVVFGTAITLFIIALLVVIFRCWQFVLLPLTICIFSVVIMLGLVSGFDWHLTVISSNFVALLLIISLQITIHLIVRFRELLIAEPQQSRQWHVANTLRSMAKPCVYTVLTTAVAFGSLVVSGIRPVIDFGWMMTLGLCVTFFLSFTLLPAGLLLLPAPKLTQKIKESQPFTLLFARLTERYKGFIVAIATVLIVLSGYGISQLKVENKFIDYFRSDTEIYQGMKVIDQQLGGTITLDIIIDSMNNNPSVYIPADPLGESDPFDEPDPFETPEPTRENDPFADADPFSEHHQAKADIDSFWFTQAGMDKIEQLHDYLDLLPEIGKVQSLAILYKVANDLNGKPLNNFELAVMRSRLPAEINNFLVKPHFNAETDQLRLSMRIQETTPGLDRSALIKKVREYAISHMGFKPSQVNITGMIVLYNNMLQSLYRSQILTIGAVFLGIMIMFFILFRSIKLAFSAMLPNMLAAAFVLGLMGLVGIALDMMTITIAAIAVGIGVDDAIHYIYRFKEEFKQRRNYRSSMYAAHGSIGSAMYYTSVTIIAGFSILVLSEFIPSVYFGLLTSLAMLAAILGALTLLPATICLLKPFGPETNKHDKPE